MIAVMTFVAAVISFTYLGSRDTPQSSVELRRSIENIIVDIEDSEVNHIWLYQGIGYSSILITSYNEINGSLVSSKIINAKNDNMYRWFIYPLDKTTGRYVKITYMASNIEIYEVALTDNNGKPSSVNIVGGSGNLNNLFDEQHLIPSNPSLMTDMYFDELYHARTALEFIREVEPYENTHPPLGKVIISYGIRLFGMNPFGWRSMVALFSVLLIPLFYYFVYLLSRSTMWASIGTGLFTIDGMRIVMGRIATLDTFAVFFILAAFTFMYLFYSNLRYNKRLYQWSVPLALSGIMWGISCAVKWTGVYAGAGLFLIFMVAIISWLIDYSKHPDRVSRMLITDKYIMSRLIIIFFLCVVFFIAIPSLIYLASYIPYKAGLDTTESLFNVMWTNQIEMYEYHSKLTADHPYGSSWYVWLFNAKPVYFYLGEDLLKESVTAKIFAFGNYATWLVGLYSIIFVTSELIKNSINRYKDKKTISDDDKSLNKRNIFLLMFYFSMLFPWIFISRVAFMYHYYGCVPPMIVITVLLLQNYYDTGAMKLTEKSRLRYLPIVIDDGKLIMGRVTTILVCLTALIVFMICYPLYTGMPVDWFIFSAF